MRRVLAARDASEEAGQVGDPTEAREFLARMSEKQWAAEMASPLNASVPTPTADDCSTLDYRRQRATGAPESSAS